MAAHWKVAHSLPPYCFMHISPPGYTGIAPTSKASANVVLVVNSDRLKNRNVGEFYLEAVMANRERRELLAGARMEEKVRTIDSLSYAVNPPPVGGLLLVGDAMGFIDPFTGEGIYLSLKSAEMAAQNIALAMAQSDFSRSMISLYEKRREKEFHKKFLLSKIIERLIAHPSLCKRVVHALNGNRRLAENLVGVIGDYIPADKVMSPRFGLRLLMALLKPGEGRRIPCGKTASALSEDR